MGNCLDAAIKYATEYKWAVFPVSPQTKKPLTPHGCKDAKKSVGAIRAWWKRWPNASVGVATGSISNLVVIDEDLDEDKGLYGFREVDQWERTHTKLPETVRAITGRGGAHCYYRYTGDDIKNRAGILPGVDVRGEGGYVVAPPSVHPNGTEYQWEIAPEEMPVADLDDTVREFLSIGQSKTSEVAFNVPKRIASGERNDTLFRLACSLQSQGLPDAAIISALRETNEKACDIPLNDDELMLIASSALKYSKGELRVLSSGLPEWHEPRIAMQLDKNGDETDRPVQSIANAEEAIMFDKELFGRIRYNELSYAPYVYGTLPWKTHKGWREWNNVDDSNLRSYIESKYGLKNTEKVMDALNNIANRYPVNPIKEMLETALDQWDGNKYVENLLPMMLGVEKTEYSTAVMRLFMMGAVARIYNPGCKFDYMLILVGEQGKGKSTFLRLLTINENWFNDNFNSLEGDKAFEKLRGMWIVEMSELQATKRARDVETIKSFITSRVDTYRAPYARRTEARPRMCVLAGTSNPVDFLTDKTGNRRFLPITCNVKEPTFDMFADEVRTKGVFMQAWGEIMHEFTAAGKKASLTLPRRLQDEALNRQSEYLEEDTRIGLIQEYLDTHSECSRVCALMLWKGALGHLYDEPQHKDINAIHDIMKNNITGWRSVGKQKLPNYGVTRCYERIEQFVDVSGEEVPFES